VDSIIQTPSYSIIDHSARRIVFSLLGGLKDCGLIIQDHQGQYVFGELDAALQARVEVNDARMYRRLLSGGNIGIAESYVDGDWQSPDLTAVIRVFARNLATLERLEKRLGWITWPWHRLQHLLNSNSRAGSRSNIAAHYDIGNDLYRLMLDPHMQYSSAIYAQPTDSLEKAQINKLHMICDALQLGPDDHLLEIGTGWGGLACFAARHYGCRVTTTTLSRRQYEYTREQLMLEGLQDRVTLLLQDYRDLQGQYDKLVSVEMIEAVGHRYLPDYFEQLERLLKDDGRMLIQAITIADQQYGQYRKGVDFIQRYIFPGGCLPSVSEMTRQLSQRTSMTLTRLNDYGKHYAQTIHEWSARFNARSQRLQELGYDEYFQRLWQFYFAYCEGGFREGAIGLVHFEAAKPGARRCADGSGCN